MKLIIAANTLSQVVGKIVGATTTFLITLLLARQFGVTGYGDVIKVTTYVGFFFLVSDFGLNAIYLRRQDTHALSVLLATRLTLAVFLVFIAVSLLAFLPQSTSDGYTNIVRLGIILFSPAIIFQSLITTANAVFQKRLRYDLATLALGAGSMLSLATLWFTLKTPVSAVLAGTLTLLTGSLTTAIFAFLGVRMLRESVSLSFSWKHNLPMFLEALPLGLTLLFNLVYGHVDSVILTLTRPTAEVGIYGLAYKLFELVLVFPTFFINALYPVLLKARSQEAKFLAIIRKSLLFLIVASGIAVIAVRMASPLVTAIQPDFQDSILPLRILSLSFPFFFASALTMWTLITLGKQKSLVWIYGLSMIMNVLFNSMLVPQYGYLAAAWITVASEGIVLIVSGIVLRKALQELRT